MSRDVFDRHIESAHRWLDPFAAKLKLRSDEHGRALHALRAGLHAIRDRLPAAEVLDLGAQLPVLIRGFYFDGWTLTHDPGEIRTRAALFARVEHELGEDARLDAIDVLRGTIQLLMEHVSPGEVGHIRATLPRSIAVLWDDVLAN